MQAGMESCLTKSIMAGGMGFALGGAFGLFMSSMSYDTPLSSPINPLNPANAASHAPALTTSQQLKLGLKDMGTRSYSSAKNFALIGAMYSGTECVIEGFRAKSDLTNSVSAGCITGAALAWRAGPS